MIIDKDKPVIFIDIDGVFNSSSLDLLEANRKKYKLNDLFRLRVGPKRDWTYAPIVRSFISICKKHDVQLMIVSSWVRSYLTEDDDDIQLMQSYFRYPNVLGSLKTSGSTARGDAVAEFIKRSGIENYFIIDDCPQFYHNHHDTFKDRLIETSGKDGLQYSQIMHIDHMLSNQDTKTH